VLATFPARLRDAAVASLTRLGVEVRTGTVVTEVDAEGVKIGNERISAQTVLWAAGVAASPVGRSLGVPLDRAGRVSAEPTLQVPGIPAVFVVGDICALQQDGKWLPGVAQVAKQGGQHAAKNILRAIRGQALEPFHYRDYGNLATIGRGCAVADIGPLKVSGFFAWLIWVLIHIFWLIGFRNRVAVMSEWAFSYLTMQRRVRLITGGKLWPGSGKVGQAPESTIQP
jgi:NADH dehydrogenase